MFKKYDFSELSALVNINSYTYNKVGVDKNGQIMKTFLEELQYTTKIYKRTAIGNHLYFLSQRSEGKKVLLLGHLDTVFPPLTFENFEEDDEWIYGPGVCDMKGGNFIALEALRNIKKRYSTIVNIDFLLVSDEETGSHDSKNITAKIAKDYDYCLVFEAAGKNDEVVTARKGAAIFHIDIEGKAAHAGNDYLSGVNANLEAAEKLIALTDLTNLEKGTTVNVGKMEGGIGSNTISPHAKLAVEIRYTNINERDRVLKELHNIVHNPFVNGTKAKLSGEIPRDVMQSNERQMDFLKQIENLTAEKIIYESRGGLSDANITASQGIITIDGLGPFGDGDHTVCERALKKSYMNRIELVTKILCGFVDGYFKS